MLEFLRKWISKKEPWFFENSSLPVWLSKVAPIEVFAFSFGPFVWCRERLPISTRQHEIIHYHQQLEMLFIGQWILYGYYWISGKFSGLSGKDAYYMNPFEAEAYANDNNVMYLDERPLWAWRKYIT